MIWLASFAAVASIAVLRWAWSLPQRSHGLNALGWGLMLLAMILGWSGAGAWGCSVASLAGMAAALLLLAHAAATSRSTAARASNRRAAMLAGAGEPLGIWRRVLTFLIVVPLALASSIGIAVGIRSLALALDAGEADGNALAFFVMPLAWSSLVFYLLMDRRRPWQFAVLGLTALAGLPAFLGGSA